MKNSKWFKGLCLAAVVFSGDSSASVEVNISDRLDLKAKLPITSLLSGDILVRSGDILVGSGGNPLTVEDRIARMPVDRTLSGGGGSIELKSPGSIKNQGSILSSLVMTLPSEPTFLAHLTSGMPRIGDNFDIQVWAISSLANASIDEMILGFGFNAELSGTGSAQFLGRSIHPLFTDISAQEGVNLSAAGLAFPGLSGTDAGSLLLLAMLHFQALTAGDLNIAISSDLNDLNQGLIYLTQSPLAIQANTSLTITAVPLPPSVILFATAGFLMLTGRRKIAG